MKTLIAVMAFLLVATTAALAQRVSISADLQIFDDESGKLQKQRGYLVIGNLNASVSSLQILNASRKPICSGSRSSGRGGGSFKGKCFGIDASGRYTQSLNGVVSGRWDYKGSWMSLRAKVF